MNRLRLLCCLACVLFAVPALAAGSGSAGNGIAPYVELKAGADCVRIRNIRNTTDMQSPAPVTKPGRHDCGGMVGGAAGLDFGGLGVPVRVELEYATHSGLSYDADPTFINAMNSTSFKSRLSSRTLFLNAYYDIATGTAFTPYVGGGIGEAWNHAGNTLTRQDTGGTESANETTERFAWNLGIGCTYAVTAGWALDAEYRYLDLGRLNWKLDRFGGLSSREVTAQDFLLGVRHRF